MSAPPLDMHERLERLRQAYRAEPNPSHSARDDRLARLAMLVTDHGDAIADAILADFGHRSRHETRMSELVVVQLAIRHARRHLKRWLQPRRRPTAWYFLPASSRIHRQPLGVVGIVSPWNYPCMLALDPAVGALAAGNRVMIKPSELAPGFSELLAQLVGRYFADDEMTVVTGDADVAREFTSLPFDHLLFTGSTPVGRFVAQAAAKNLTPVTLELGGKSPVILDASCDLDIAARRLLVGKLLNAGQSCVAPDYVLLPAGREQALLDALQSALARLYPTLADNPDYSSIASDRHWSRLVGLAEDAQAKGARIVVINPANEEFPAASRKLPLHVLFDVNDSMTVMQDEIFGPLLPIVSVADIGEAIDYVNRHPRPLALYWFGNDAANRERVLSETISGGVTLNDTLFHLAQEELPFGGVGASGYGAYHGEHGFLTFTHEKPVFRQARLNGSGLLAPPYGRTFERVLALVKRFG